MKKIIIYNLNSRKKEIDYSRDLIDNNSHGLLMDLESIFQEDYNEICLTAQEENW